MAIFSPQIFTLLGLILALVMTLTALVSYHLFEKTKKQLAERDERLKDLKQEFTDFTSKSSQAFSERNELRTRIDNLEARLKVSYADLEKEREDFWRLSGQLEKLRADYEAAKLNLSDAYKRLRESRAVP